MASPDLEQFVQRLHLNIAHPEHDLLAPGSTWNLSQTVQHCAQTVRYSVTGYPVLKPVWYRATIGRLAKMVFLRRGAMKHPLGAEIEGAPALEPGLSVSDAAADLADAVALFTGHTAGHATHPAYGHCTHDEFAQLHAMHLADHLPGVATS
ncbi:DUF1569 domain-containing protein [Streptomyces scabiei]|uniref:DUF1569 domain-containing protein n=1 Tax=Streptomyces scabiei TaxID=1930 RepID=UPI0033DE2354